MWYIVNYIPPAGRRRADLPAVVGAYCALHGVPPVEVFAPTFIRLEAAEGGRVKKTERPLLYHYVFLRGSAQRVKSLCSEVDGFSLILNRTSSSSRYLSVSDETLDHFRIIARYHSGKLPCYPLEGISLEEGDRVQVVSGPFAGLSGSYISRRGGKRGNILVSVDGQMAAVVYDVPASYVRVLEFARDSRRLYDQLDAYSDRLRALADPASPGIADIAAASSFVTRLGAVRVANPKTEARLRALLYAAYRLLSDLPNAAAALARYRELEHHVTNPKTRSFIESLISR